MSEPTNTGEPDATKIAQWFEQPLTPGQQREFTDWLADSPDNQSQWDRWSDFNESARALKLIPTEAGSSWEALKDEFGFQRATKRKSIIRPKLKKRSIFKAPIVVAISSVLLFAAFLLFLHLLRLSIGY
jgi:ferric-dicitrate binding protein FerR (iron transport regulator)